MLNDDWFVKLRGVVGNLNDSLYIHISEDVALPAVMLEPFRLITVGGIVFVQFADKQLWNSDDNPGETLEEIIHQIVTEAEDILLGYKMMRITGNFEFEV